MIQVEQHGPVIAIRLARGFLGRPLYWTTVYWVDGLLIDSGPAVGARDLLRVLEQVEVRQIAITHGHEDHIGGLAALRRRYPDAPVYASRRTADLIRDPAALGMQFYRRMVWGAPAPLEGVTALDAVDDRITTRNYRLRAVETPGHSPDHVAYFEPRLRWLFAGDAFIGGRDRTWAPEFDLFAVLGSLQMLVSLEPARLFPGSGNVRRNPVPDLLDKINYLTELAAAVGKLDAAGVSSAEIAALLLPDDRRMAFWTQRHYTAVHLVEACRSYNALMAPAPHIAALPPPAQGAPKKKPPQRKSADPGDRSR